MTDKGKKTVAFAIAAVLCAVVGFFVGRSTIEKRTVTVIKHIKGETITVTKDSLIPVYVAKPADTTDILLSAIKSGKFTDLFPVRDSIIYVTKDDTSAVISDWATERFYKETLFDIDTVGTAVFEASVQYNRLGKINTEFTPVVKEITNTNTIVKRYSPFVGPGLTTSNGIIGTVGIFFEDKYGFSALYEYNINTKQHIFGAVGLYKF